MADSSILKPDFIIIGAMKSGTSTLQTQLAAQTGVFMTNPKEPNFFSDDAIYNRGIAWYENLFSEARADDVKGEASTHYTKLPTYPETLIRMQAALPNVRLIYLIRNPIQRAISHYIHEWSEARMGDNISEAFSAHQELIDYGCYGMQILPYINAYGAANVHLTSLEQLKANPHAEFRKICTFLGMSESAAWKDNLDPQNVSAERARRFPLQSVFIDNPIATTLRHLLVPKSIRARIRQTRTMRARPDLPTPLKTSLEAIFLKDRKILSRAFPEHPALTHSYTFSPQ